MSHEVAAKVSGAAARMAAGQTAAAELFVEEAAKYPAGMILPSVSHLMLTSNCPFEMYFSADILKKTAIRDWRSLSDADRTALFNFPMTCLKQRQKQLPANAREQLFHLYATVSKLGWETLSGTPNSDIAGFAASIVGPILAEMDADLAVAAALATHVVGEYHSTEAGRLGMSWETHEALRRSFQTHALPALFNSMFGGADVAAPPLARLVDARDPRVRVPVLRYVAEGLLSWDFGKRCADEEEDGSEVMNAGAEWRGVLLCETTVSSLLRMHAGATADEQHYIQEAVIQLCGVTGKVFRDEAERVRWLELMLRALFELARRAIEGHAGAGAGALLHSACRGFRRASQCTSARHWYGLPSSSSLLTQLRDLTCALCTELGRRPGDKWLVESLDLLLTIWSCQLIDMLDDMMYFSSGESQGTDGQKQFLRECCVAIFTAYRESQLAAPPQGGAGGASGGDDLDDDDGDTGHDREYSDSTYTLVAMLGRHTGDVALHSLIDALQQVLAQVQSAPQSMDDVFFDRLTFVVALGAAVCADPGQGEVPAIPAVLMDRARQHEDLPPAQREEANAVLKFVKLLFTLANALLDIAARRGTAVSPLAVAEVFKGLARYTKSYISADPDDNIELTAVFTDAFEEGRWAAGTLVWLCNRGLNLYAHDTEVTDAAIDSLMALACKRPVQQWLSSLPAWSELAAAEAQERSPLDALPLVTRRRLVEVLCLGSGKEAFQCLLPSIERYIVAALDAVRAAKGRDDEHAQRLLIALQRVRGVGCSSIYAQERQDVVFNWVQGLFPVLVELSETLRSRHDIVATLFELLDDLVKAQNAFIEEAQINILLSCSLQMTQVYCKHNATPLTIQASRLRKAHEEDQVNLLVAVMTLLRHVVEWDMLNRSINANLPDAGNVVLLGVHHILSVLTPAFLDDMALANVFYALLDGCFTMYCGRLTLVPDRLVEQLVQALVFAIGSPQADIQRAGYRCIAALCSFCKHVDEAGGAAPGNLKESLPHFLERILSSMVTERLSPATIPAVSRAVLGLCRVLGCEVPAQILHALATHPQQRDRLLPPFVACLRIVQERNPQDRAAADAFHAAFESFALVCRVMRM